MNGPVGAIERCEIADGDPTSAILASLGARLGSRTTARWILESLGVHDTDAIDRSQRERLEHILERLENREPLQYVLASWSFFGVELGCDPRALIMRPETEVLVELAFEVARRTSSRPGTFRIADLGTGSGAIALALAVALRAVFDLRVIATDRSIDALSLAHDNVARIESSDPSARVGSVVELRCGDWYGALNEATTGAFDLICANPPYVSEAQYAHLEPELYFEPKGALVAPDARGIAGFADVEAVIKGAPRWLRPGGWLLVEMDPNQTSHALELSREVGFSDATIETDLARRPRFLCARG